MNSCRFQTKNPAGKCWNSCQWLKKRQRLSTNLSRNLKFKAVDTGKSPVLGQAARSERFTFPMSKCSHWLWKYSLWRSSSVSSRPYMLVSYMHWKRTAESAREKWISEAKRNRRSLMIFCRKCRSRREFCTQQLRITCSWGRRVRIE